ncbi:hypothetical protein F5X68DRAFT_257473 [Plectosphaerella plurivora]|uniref:DNA damage-responsive protein 48 n=1 Tax=Plectosphaerella plurivora TaxID=936078 RepID=A0A9P8VKJ1_9PEZI|nr:hypothetical protein F5X68DRAFT_257473 [Plectosphaerella plurivora]
MDFVNNLTGGGNSNNNTNQQQSTDSSKPQESSGGGLMDKVNSMAGGGQQGEKNEDFLDKTVDFVQEKMGAGDQSNESAAEQAKDEQISDFIRGKYKDTTGGEFPVADKDKNYGV